MEQQLAPADLSAEVVAKTQRIPACTSQRGLMPQVSQLSPMYSTWRAQKVPTTLLIICVLECLGNPK